MCLADDLGDNLGDEIDDLSDYLGDEISEFWLSPGISHGPNGEKPDIPTCHRKFYGGNLEYPVFHRWVHGIFMIFTVKKSDNLCFWLFASFEIFWEGDLPVFNLTNLRLLRSFERAIIWFLTWPIYEF